MFIVVYSMVGIDVENEERWSESNSIVVGLRVARGNKVKISSKVA